MIYQPRDGKDCNVKGYASIQALNSTKTEEDAFIKEQAKNPHARIVGLFLRAEKVNCADWQPGPLNPFPFPEQMGADEAFLLEKVVLGDVVSSCLSNGDGIV